MGQDVFITSLGEFLPGLPIQNEDMEKHLGLILGKESKAKRVILAQNKILTRHYALDNQGNVLHQNYEMAAKALENCLAKSQIDKSQIEYLASATTLSDVLVPGIAALVQGEAKIPRTDIASFGGVCASSVAALKSAYAQIKSGLVKTAAVTGSEFASRHFQEKNSKESTL